MTSRTASSHTQPRSEGAAVPLAQTAGEWASPAPLVLVAEPSPELDPGPDPAPDPGPDLAWPSEPLAPRFPLDDRGTGLVLYDSGPGELLVHWCLDRDDFERTSCGFPAGGRAPAAVVRLRRDRGEGGSDLAQENRLAAGVREGRGETRFHVPPDHRRYCAELGLSDGEGGWLMLVRSNGLYNALGVGLALVTQPRPAPTGTGVGAGPGPVYGAIAAGAAAPPAWPDPAGVPQTGEPAPLPGPGSQVPPVYSAPPPAAAQTPSIAPAQVPGSPWAPGEPALWALLAALPESGFPLAAGLWAESGDLAGAPDAPATLRSGAAQGLAQSHLPTPVWALAWLDGGSWPTPGGWIAPVQGALEAELGIGAAPALGLAQGRQTPGIGDPQGPWGWPQDWSPAGPPAGTSDGPAGRHRGRPLDPAAGAAPGAAQAGLAGDPVPRLGAAIPPLVYESPPQWAEGLELEAQLRIHGRAAPGSEIDLFGHPFRVGPGGRFLLTLKVEDPQLLRRALDLAPPPELALRRDP